METLEALTVELRDVRGGELLQRLKTMAGAGGDEASRNLHTFLLHQVRFPIRGEHVPDVSGVSGIGNTQPLHSIWHRS